MGLDAGSVYATLGAKVNPAGFQAYKAELEKSAAQATKAETASKRAATAAETAAVSQATAQRRVSQAYESTSGKVQKAARDHSQAVLNVEQAQARATAAQREANRVGVATQKQSMAVRQSALDLASAQSNLHGSTVNLSKVQKDATLSGRAMSSAHVAAARGVDILGTGLKYGLAGGALAAGAALVYSVKVAADFEHAMRNVNSIAQLTPARFKALSNSVRSMAADTAQTPQQLAEGLYTLVSSGIKAGDAMFVLRASAIAASAGLTDTQTAITPIVGALNAYHLRARDASKVSDILFQTVNRGVLTFKDLATGLGPVLPMAAGLHIPLNQVGASLSTLTKEGIPAADAMTYLTNVYKGFIHPSTGLNAAIKKTGYESGESLIKAKGFQGALEAVRKTTDGSQKSMGKLFTDTRELKGALGLTGENARKAAEDLKAFSAAGTKGATSKVMAEQAKSASFQFQQLKANASAALIQLGNVLLPSVNKGVRDLSKSIAQMTKDGSFKRIGEDVQGVGSTIGDVATTVGDVWDAVGKLQGSFGNLFQGIGKAKQDLEFLFSGFDSSKDPMIVHPKLDTGSMSHQIGNLAGLASAANVPPLVIKTVLEGDNTVKTKMAALAAMVDGIPPARILAILAGDNTVKVKIAAIRAEVAHVPDALVTAIITGDNTVKVKLAALNAAAHHVPDALIRAILAGDNSVKVKLAALDAASHGVPDAKIRAILSNDASVKKKIEDLHHAVDAVPNSIRVALQSNANSIQQAVNNLTGAIQAVPTSIGISVGLSGVGAAMGELASLAAAAIIHPRVAGHASGRGSAGAEAAVVSEHAPRYPEWVGNDTRGWYRVDHPTLLGLAPDDAVIPTEPRYAGNAMRFLRQMVGPNAGRLAHEMGVHGYKTGKPSYLFAKHSTDWYDTRKSSEEDRVRTLKSDAKERDSKKKLTRKARNSRKALPKAERTLAAHTREWKAAHHYASRIEADTKEADIQVDNMTTAEAAGDQGGYNKAFSRRRDKLKDAVRLLEAAIPKWADNKGRQDLRKQLSEIQAELGQTPSSPPDLTRPDGSTFSKAQQKRIDDDQKAVALAALTAGIGDDTAAGGRLVSDLQGYLNSAITSKAPSTVITDIATQLKSAKDMVAGLTPTDNTPDLQAQLAQANQRATDAETRTRITERVLGVLGGPGEIGVGGANTYQAGGGFVQNNYMLHPGDPSVHKALAASATQGFRLQQPRQPVRVNV